MLKPLRLISPERYQVLLPHKPFLPKAVLILLMGPLTGLTMLHAQNADTLTLQKALAKGLEQNYQIRLAKQDRKQDRNNVSRGNAGFLPTLRLTANQTNEINNTRQDFISGETINRNGAESESFNTRADLQWTLFDGFRMFTSYDRLQAIRKQGKAAFKQTVQEQLGAIIDQYYALAQLKQELNTRREAVRLTRKRLSLAKTRMNIGSGSELAYRQVQSDYNADTAAYLEKRQTYQTAKLRLNRLMGTELGKEYTVPGSIPLQSNFQYQALKQKTLEQNPRLAGATQEKQIAKHQLEATQGQNYPEIGLNVGYNFSSTSSEAGFLRESEQHGVDYGFFLNYDLFDGFNTSRQTENARIGIEKARLSFEQTRRQVLADLRESFTAYQQGRSRVALEASNVKTARETFQLAQTNYEAGGIDYVQLQEAQQAYLEASERLTNARYETKQSEIRLMRLSGMLLNQPSNP